jgi:hypothetical protein
VPTNYGFGPYDQDGINHTRAEAIEPDERQPIGIGRPAASGYLSPQYVRLMTEKEILGFEPAARFHQRRQPMHQQFDHSQHARE